MNDPGWVRKAKNYHTVCLYVMPDEWVAHQIWDQVHVTVAQSQGNQGRLPFSKRDAYFKVGNVKVVSVLRYLQLFFGKHVTDFLLMSYVWLYMTEWQTHAGALKRSEEGARSLWNSFADGWVLPDMGAGSHSQDLWKGNNRSSLWAQPWWKNYHFLTFSEWTDCLNTGENFQLFCEGEGQKGTAGRTLFIQVGTGQSCSSQG